MSNQPQKPTLSNQIGEFLKFIPLDYIFAAFCAAFCLSSFITLLINDISYTDVSFILSVSLPSFAAAIAVITAALITATYISKFKPTIPLALLSCELLFGCALSYKGSVLGEENNSIFIDIAIGFIVFLTAAWTAKGDKLNLKRLSLPKNTAWFAGGVGLVLFVVFVSIASISRYSAYMAHNFDFGIFTQMFENMRTTGLPDTTVERNVLMSHFGVHFSPFYYVLLPFYSICPRPETLLVLQALFVAAGVVPVILICRRLNLGPAVQSACALIYIFFPALANGCLYDFHENKFLTVLIMWAMYFIIKENTIGTIVFCALTLTVKEDAAIYIMAIALYIILSQKKYLLGGGILTGAIVYFVFAASMVAMFGDGVMTSRLGNYMAAGEMGFGAVIKTCFGNIGYLLSQVFTAEKLMFAVWMLLPVGFAPFLSRNKSLLVLLIPMVVVNLMSNWQYQYNISYQYTYGSAALIIFMLIVVIAKKNSKTKNSLLIFSLSMCVIMSFSLFVPRAVYYINCSETSANTTSGYNELISQIPEDAEITANGSFIPHMYYFKNLYQYPNYYAESEKTEYLLVSSVDVNENNDGLADFMGDDYQLINSSGNMALYKLK